MPKKLVLLAGTILFLLVLAYSVLGGFPVGFSKNHILVFGYHCSDVCPNYGSWNRFYFGVKNEEECAKINNRQPSLTMFWTFCPVE